MTRNLRTQLHSMINSGETLVNVINYLFTCDYEVIDILNILTSKGFNCKRELIADTLHDDFGIEICPFWVKGIKI
jgi:hypothetical protein